jgi:hypothetical protein
MEHINIINYNKIFKVLIVVVLLYFTYTVSKVTSATITYIEQTNIDSPYFTPEGWPIPYPYNNLENQ